MAFNNTHIIISRCLVGWVSVAILGILVCLKNSHLDLSFYRFGPGENLYVIGIHIETLPKYIILVMYCFINSAIRGLVNTFLHPWIINYVQNTSVGKLSTESNICYEVSLISTFYQWFDWFIYMNILLSQIDLVIYEIIADMIVSFVSTKYYIKHSTNIPSESSSLLNNRI